MIDRSHELALSIQARSLGIARSTVYREPQPVSASDLAVMHRIDELHLDYPFAGSRMLRAMLVNEGITIGRTHVRTLMRRMGGAGQGSACEAGGMPAEGSRRCIGVRGQASQQLGTGSTRICCVTWR